MPSDSRGTTAVTGRFRVCGRAARGPRLQGHLSGLVASLSLLSEQEPQGAQLLSAALEELSRFWKLRRGGLSCQRKPPGAAGLEIYFHIALWSPPPSEAVPGPCQGSEALTVPLCHHSLPLWPQSRVRCKKRRRKRKW